MTARLVQAFVLSSAVLASVSAVAFTAGWRRLPPEQTAPLPTNTLWRADFAVGLDGFTVEKREGAQGRVYAVSGGIRVEKTNEDGYILVKPREPFVAPPGTKLRAFAEVSEATGDSSASVQCLRLVGSGGNLMRSTVTELGADGYGGPVETFAVNTPHGVELRKFANNVVCEQGKPRWGGIDGTNVTPVILMAGAPSAATWTNWAVADFEAMRVGWARYCEKLRRAGRRTRDYTTNLSDRAEIERRIAADFDHTAEIVRENGFSRLMLDGTVSPCVFYRDVASPRVNCGRRFAAAGINLQTVVLPFGGRLDCPDRCTLWTDKGFNAARGAEEVMTALRRSPDALLMICLSVNPPVTYHRDHPDEVSRDEKGSIVYAHGCHVYMKPDGASNPMCWPQISPHSLVWRAEVKECISKLVAELKRTGLSKRVVGAQISGFHDGQFALPVMDHSAPAQTAYREWLRRRYGDVKELSRAWGRNLTSFDEVMLPVRKEYGDYYTGKDYFDPVADRALFDYNLFHHRSMIEVQEDLARHVKTCFGKRMFCAKWCMGSFGGQNMSSYDFSPFVQDDGIDILVAQASYANRPPCIVLPEFRVPTSFHEHGKLYMNELDFPTWFSGGYGATESHAVGRGWVPDFGAWETINRKAAGQMFALHHGYWYYDMSGTAYDDDRQLTDIAALMTTARTYVCRPLDLWRPSAALVVDEESMLMRNTIGRWMFDENLSVRGQVARLSGSGVPFDMYLADDFLRNPSLADRYRLIVIMGMNYIDESRRKMVKKLADGGRTLVFVGGAGHLGGAKEALGVEVETTPRPAGHQIRPESGFSTAETRSFLHSFALGMTLGAEGSWSYNHHRTVRFSVKDAPGVKVLARYVEGGTAAIAEKAIGTARVVHVCDIAGLSPGLFNRLVRESGGYVALPSSVAQVDMNGDFISIHALSAWKGIFRLPFTAKVVNLASGAPEPMCSDNQSFELDIDAGETCWFGMSRVH